MEKITTTTNKPSKTSVSKLRIIMPITLLIIGFSIFEFAYILKIKSTFFGVSNQAVLDFFVKLRSNKLTDIFMFITNLVSPTNTIIAVGLITIFWIITKKETIRPLLFGGTVFVAAGVSYVLKELFKNSRPPEAMMISPFELDYSFPSGHTLCILVLALAVGYLIYTKSHNIKHFIKWMMIGFITSFIIAVSRLYLGYHWMSDIIASIGLSLVVVGLMIIVDTLIKKITKNKLQ